MTLTRREPAGTTADLGAQIERGRTTGRVRTAIVCVALALAGLALFVVSLSAGTFAVPLRDVLPAALGQGPSSVVRSSRITPV